jgi:hypothetical protein
MRLLACGLLTLLIGCVTTPREPYLWRDDIPPVGVHRADVARAEARVVEYLLASGTMGPEEVSCGNSPRAYRVVTTETENAYEVRVGYRPGLCNQAPEDPTLPPHEGIYEAPMEFAVSKKDFHIIRERLFRGDPYVPMKRAPPEPDPVLPPFASALAFTTASLSTTAGACTGPVAVETREEETSGRKVLADPVTLKWAAVPASAVFFSDATCTTALASVDMPAKTSSAEVYFRAVQAGPLQITASAEGLSDASQTYTVGPGRAVAIAFSTPAQNIAPGTCSSAVTLQPRDAFDNPASVPAETSVELLATPKGGVTFYARSDCKGAPITSASIPAGGDSASFYFKGRLPRTVTIAATLGVVTASQELVIAPAKQ